MSRTVDERIVSMQFDNQHFEKNVQTSISTIDKLKQSLNLTGAAKGLENVGDAAKGVNMSPLTGAVEQVSLKFSAMQIAATTALANIVNSAVNAGKRIVSALTIDPVKMGFNEYELKMGSIQTIMSSTGESLDTVNQYLGELNEYSDKTIYSFQDMTSNIGKFTNAGVNLEDSVAAIKGVSNVAAVSGANAGEASRAMYNFAQALSSGYVKLIDWKSIENANMATVEFKEHLLESAVAQGKLKKTSNGMYQTLKGTAISATKGFNDSLQEQWMTSEVLIGTLKEYSDETTAIGQKAAKAATEVKTFSQLFDTLKESAQSGWAQTWEILVGDFEEAKTLLASINDVIGGAIGNAAEARNDLLENWKVLGGRDDIIDSVKNAFDGLMSVITPIKEAFREIFPPTTAEQLKGFSAGLKELTEKLKLNSVNSENLKRTFKGLFAVLDIVKQLFGAVIKAASSLFGTVGSLGGGILGITAAIGDWLVALSEAIKDSDIFNKVLQGIADVVKAALGGFKAFLGFIGTKIVSPGLDLLRSLLDTISTKMSGLGKAASGMKNGLVSTFNSMGKTLVNSTLFKVMEILWKGVTILAETLGKALGVLVSGIGKAFSNGSLSNLVDIINGIISGGIGIAIMTFIKNMSDSFEGIGDIIEGLGDTLEGFQQQLKAGALLKIAQAIAILTASLFVLSLIDSNKLSDAIVGISALFGELLVAMNVMGKLNGGKGTFNVSATMISLSTSLLILATAMKIMSTMSLQEMCIGLMSIATSLGLLLAAVNVLPESKVNKAAKAIKTMSTSLLILAVALKIMGSMSWSEMTVGLITMATSLGVLLAAVNVLPKDTGMKVAGLLSLSAALVVLSVALKIMATMSWGDVAVSLVTLAGSLAILAGGMKLMTSAIPGAFAMLIIAPALIALAGALLIMGTMSWGDLAVSLVALAGSLAILAAAMYAMTSALPGAAAMLVVAPALVVLAGVLTLLGSMSWESIIKGLVSLAGAFTVIGVAGYLLAPIIPAILSLAGAIALMGAGVLAAGIGLVAFGAGLSALAVGFTAIIASLSAIVTGIIAMVSAIITGILKGIADGIVAFCQVIIAGGSSIFEAVKVIIIGVSDVVIQCIPDLLKALHVLLTELLEFIVGFVPELVDAGIRLIVGLLNGIAQRIPEIIDAGVNVIISFIRGLTSTIPRLVDAGFQAMIALINGLANSIRTNTPLLINAVNNLMSAVAEAIGMFIGNFPELGRQIVSGLKKGIEQAAGGFISSVTNMASRAWSSFKKFFGIKSPSRLAIEGAMYIDEGLAVGLDKYAYLAGDAAVGVGETTMSSLSEALKGVADVVDSDMDLQPTIRPVIDLTDVKTGVASMNGMLADGPTMGVSANINAISSSMKGLRQNGGNDAVVSAVNKLRDDLKNISNTTYTINGITYDDGSNISQAIETIIRAANIVRRA